MLSVLTTAWLAGLLGSGHCLGMCGGIAAARSVAQERGGQSGQSQSRWLKPLHFNLGRITTYSILGAAVGGITGAVGTLSGLQQWGLILRLLTALLIFLIGCQYLFRIAVLAWIERTGAKAWRLITNSGQRLRTGHSSAFIQGLYWGGLPCGLVYTLLLMAASSGSWYAGAAVMAAFGLGTLPAMLATSTAAPTLLQWQRTPHIRAIIGIAMLLFAVWTAVFALMHAGYLGGETHHHH